MSKTTKVFKIIGVIYQVLSLVMFSVAAILCLTIPQTLVDQGAADSVEELHNAMVFFWIVSSAQILVLTFLLFVLLSYRKPAKTLTVYEIIAAIGSLILGWNILAAIGAFLAGIGYHQEQLQ